MTLKKCDRAIVIFVGFCFVAGALATPPAQTAHDKNDSKQEDRVVDATPEHKHTNNLIHSTSPYLLQHAHNPVDWNEWGDEAFAKAKREDKPIFLSIGYAACHWCHVMEHESFENEDVAGVLNDGFISIKVDREERPDIDEIYMAYTQNTTGSGGWPMSLWLTPDGTPLFAGTYFPKRRFVDMLTQISHLWNNERERLLIRSNDAKDFFARWEMNPEPAPGVPTREVVDEAARQMARYFDRSLGGTRSSGNKFPPSMAMDLMLRVYRRTGDADLFEAVEITLDQMGRGGIYDHLGGGICRYSTDPEWLVPHFEKMLYDQGLVSAIYLDAYQATRNSFYARVAADIFDYVIDDLQSPEGGIYSSRDADSGGFEGAYYIWTVQEIRKLLGEKDGELFCKYYDVTDTGNWFESRGHAPSGPKNILHVAKPPATFAKLHGLAIDDLEQKLTTWRVKLLAVRSKRVEPPLDDKVLTGWNGLMIASLAKGARVLNEDRYAAAAARAADFILKHLRDDDGRLLRTYRSGRARLTGYLSDYAFFVEGLINLYEATGELRWAQEAVKLTDLSIRYYDDPKKGGFFFTASDGEKLLARSKNHRDGAIPSGNSVQAMNLLRLAVLFDRKDYRERAEAIFRAFGPMVERSPGAFERLNCAIDFYHDRVKEIAIVGDPTDAATKSLIRTVYERYLPNKVVALSATAVGDSPIPLLAGKTLRDGKPTAYVCENYRCREPVTSPEALAKQLEGQ